MGYLSKLLGTDKAVEVAIEQKQHEFDLQIKAVTNNQSFKNISNLSRDAINNLFQYRGSTGDNTLIEEGFVSNPDVNAIITSLAELGSSIPFFVEQKTADGWELDTESRLNLLIKKPNNSLSEKDFRYNTITYLLSTGDIFWKKTVSVFELVTETELLESNLVDFLFNTLGDVSNVQYSRNNTTQINYSPTDIIHNFLLNPSIAGLQSKRGLSPLQAAYPSIISSNNRGVASGSMLENGGAANLISSGSDMLLMTPQEQEDLQSATDNKLGGARKFGKNVVTPGKVEVNSLGLTSQQMQVLEGVVIDRRTLCNVFKVDSSLFNDKEASTFNNMKSVSKSVYVRAVIPNNEKIISGYDTIIPAYNEFEGKELRVRQDISNIEALQEDQEIKAKKDGKNIESVTKVLSSPISNESKIETLVEIMKIDRDKAVLMVGKGINQDEKI